MKGAASGVAVAVACAVMGQARAAEPVGPFWSESHGGPPAPGLSRLAERARRSVVGVRGLVPDRSAGGAALSIGTGFFIEPSGLVVTNEHVVRGALSLRARLFDGREVPLCVLGYDEPTDIALLRLDPARPVPVLPLGDSDRLRTGDTAVVIGNPFGFNHSVTAGIVSARDRVLERAPNRHDDTDAYAFFIQTDASINLGNSGGPLLDAQGVVVGVSSAFWGSTQPAQGIGFAIPINVVKLLLPPLRTQGHAPRSQLGVEGQPLDPALVDALGLPSAQGALLASIEPGSAAAKAGLLPGDVVVGWGHRALSGFEDFKIYAQLTPPGTRVPVAVLRHGRRIERTVVTQPLATSKPHVPHPSACGTPVGEAAPLGLEVADVPASRSRNLPGAAGVEVSRVSGGAAREAGLNVGDVILRVGDMPIGNAEEFQRALARIPAGRPYPLLCRREGADFWVALPRR